MEHVEVNLMQLKDAGPSFVASGELTLDESNGQRDAQSSTTSKPPVTKRRIAISLSNFLKKQRSLLALRRQDDGKQA
jgi:hypothetical protein